MYYYLFNSIILKILNFRALQQFFVRGHAKPGTVSDRINSIHLKNYLRYYFYIHVEQQALKKQVKNEYIEKQFIIKGTYLKKQNS